MEHSHRRHPATSSSLSHVVMPAYGLERVYCETAIPLLSCRLVSALGPPPAAHPACERACVQEVPSSAAKKAMHSWAYLNPGLQRTLMDEEEADKFIARPFDVDMLRVYRWPGMLCVYRWPGMLCVYRWPGMLRVYRWPGMLRVYRWPGMLHVYRWPGMLRVYRWPPPPPSWCCFLCRWCFGGSCLWVYGHSLRPLATQYTPHAAATLTATLGHTWPCMICLHLPPWTLPAHDYPGPCLTMTTLDPA